MRTVLIGILVGAILFAATGGRVIFLPLLFVPLGISALRHRGRLMQAGRARVRSRG
jgi:uncharacterized membrane protein YdbT with pleckstrin-like domain